MAPGVSLPRRGRAWRRAAAVFLVYRRIRAEAYSRPHHRFYAIPRRRLAVAGGRAADACLARPAWLAWHLDHHRHPGADRLCSAFLAAGVATLAGDARAGAAGARSS